MTTPQILGGALIAAGFMDLTLAFLLRRVEFSGRRRFLQLSLTTMGALMLILGLVLLFASPRVAVPVPGTT
jgi:uncharacterized membrane protein HdeD (DUF308 family)